MLNEIALSASRAIGRKLPNFAEEDYSTFSNNLIRLKAAIETKDTSLAVSEALASKEMWTNLTKVVPEP